MRKVEKTTNKPFSKNEWNQEKAESLFVVFMSSVSEGGVIDLLKTDLDKNIKNKVFKDFRNICNGMVKGYKNKDFKVMLSSVEKLLDLYKYTKDIDIYKVKM